MNQALKFGLGAVVLGGLALFVVSTVTFDQVKSQPIPASANSSGNLTDWIGKAAPDFKLTATDGQEYSLSALKGKKVVLFFNEGIMCYPACWNQVAAFGTDPAFNTGDVVALSITIDNKAGWDQATGRMPQLKGAKILLDTSRTVSSQYGMLTLPSSMHRGSYPGHTYLIVDRQGIVRYALDDPRMATRNQEILAEVSKIN